MLLIWLYSESKKELNIKSDEDGYKSCYLKTYYFKLLEETSRYPDLKEAVEDLLQIFSSEAVTIMDVYQRYKSEPSKAVTMIWNNSYLVPRLINFALIVDAGNQFKFAKLLILNLVLLKGHA